VGIALIVGIVIIGGQRRITSVAELVVPFMAIAYILGSLIIMVLAFQRRIVSGLTAGGVKA